MGNTGLASSRWTSNFSDVARKRLPMCYSAVMSLHSYAEALTPSVTAFGPGPSVE